MVPGFEFKKENLIILSVWLKFAKLPLQCWGKKNLSKLAIVIGNPLHTDECTLTQAKVNFARILVEIDVTQPLKKSVRVKNPNGTAFEQQVEYECQLTYCQR